MIFEFDDVFFNAELIKLVNFIEYRPTTPYYFYFEVWLAQKKVRVTRPDEESAEKARMAFVQQWKKALKVGNV